ncbi:SDR family oxidoreductase [Roseivirga sp. E12]|uniref:SDR family oxidoreductase n=1 Tax=Roseivirga sp. E12 TaxID=2819237 RepID=UPI001ABC108E|nr:SDR family oxidoreductase [Roseivirga sp. E12]MBO3698567.1 SDR family oxidoreductase [Roseivirga sp. E12]
MPYLHQKTIWITGASSGVGEALSKRLSQLDVNLILSARREAELLRVQHECENPDRIKVLPLNLTETDSHVEKTSEAIEALGQIDILINNGGQSQRSLVKDTLLEVDRDLMEVNYFGSVSLTKLLIPHMLERGNGHFVVITSLTGIFGTPYRSGYAASKHALHGFYDSMRAELEDSGIKVTLAALGFIKTNLSIHALKGDGTALGSMDDAQANGLSPDRCAEKIIRATKHQKREVYIGKESYAAYVKRFFPGLFAQIIKKAKVR